MGIYVKEDGRIVAIDLEGGSVVVAVTNQTENEDRYSYRYYISAEEMADIVNERLGICSDKRINEIETAAIVRQWDSDNG